MQPEWLFHLQISWIHRTRFCITIALSYESRALLYIDCSDLEIYQNQERKPGVPVIFHQVRHKPDWRFTTSPSKTVMCEHDTYFTYRFRFCLQALQFQNGYHCLQNNMKDKTTQRERNNIKLFNLQCFHQ